METKYLIAIFAVATVMAAGLAMIIPAADDSVAATDPTYGTSTDITIAPGMRYTYTPTWPSDVGTVTTSIEKQKSGSLTGSDVTIATMSGGTLTVNIPSDASVGTVYHVVLKATATNPVQTAYVYITLAVSGNLAVSGSHANIIVGGSVSMVPSATGMGTKTWAVTSGSSLPSGLTIDPSTGKVTGTIASAGSYTIKLTCTTSYGESANLVVDFKVVSKLDVTNSPAGGLIVMPK